MNHKHFFGALLLGLLLASGMAAFALDGKTVYIAGNYHGSNKTAASYWENGVRRELSIPQGSINPLAIDIAVSDTDVYVAGQYDAPRGRFHESVACYWKNGTVKALTIPTESEKSFATAIALGKSGVYIAGSHTGINGRDSTCYWKDDGKITRYDLSLPAGAVSTHAGSIAISGADVYVAGFYLTASGTPYPCYWKNGVSQRFSAPVPGKAQSIKAAGSNVYIAGFYMNRNLETACYWVNGVRRELSVTAEMTESWATDISVEGSDVYVSGYVCVVRNRTEFYSACYWVNGVRHDLSAPAAATLSTQAVSIVVRDSNIYIAGIYRPSHHVTYSCYWFNGKRQDITAPGGAGSEFITIAVMPSGISSPVLAAQSAVGNSNLLGTWETEIRDGNYRAIHRRVFEANGTWKTYHIDSATMETTLMDSGTYTVSSNTVTIVDNNNFTRTAILDRNTFSIREDGELRIYRKR